MIYYSTSKSIKSSLNQPEFTIVHNVLLSSLITVNSRRIKRKEQRTHKSRELQTKVKLP